MALAFASIGVLVAVVVRLALVRSERAHVAAWGMTRRCEVRGHGAYRTASQGGLALHGAPRVVRSATRLGIVVGSADVVFGAMLVDPPRYTVTLVDWVVVLLVPSAFALLGAMLVRDSFRLARCAVNAFVAPASTDLSGAIHGLTLIVALVAMIECATPIGVAAILLSLAAMEQARRVHKSLPCVRQAQGLDGA